MAWRIGAPYHPHGVDLYPRGDLLAGRGLVLFGGDEDDYGLIAKAGLWDLDASIPEGESVVLSNTSGGIGPPGDLATGEYISILGTQGKTGFKIDINNTGETAT